MTAMEEKGKVGAGHFDTSVLTGTRMIDFNWITDNEILAGCSGDVTFLIDVPGEFEPVPAELSATRSLKVRGLMGGHCEFDIHLERANAILVLARVLNAVIAKHDLRISGLYGGAQNSAIPADAEAVLSLRPEDVAEVEALVAELGDTLHREYQRAGDNIRLEFEEADGAGEGVLQGFDRAVRPAHRADPERRAELEPADSWRGRELEQPRHSPPDRRRRAAGINHHGPGDLAQARDSRPGARARRAGRWRRDRGAVRPGRARVPLPGELRPAQDRRRRV